MIDIPLDATWCKKCNRFMRLAKIDFNEHKVILARLDCDCGQSNVIVMHTHNDKPSLEYVYKSDGHS